MRAVLDTNVLVAALLWRGPPHALLQLARSGTLSLVSSPALLAELAEVLERPKFSAMLERLGASVPELLAQVRQLVEIVDPPPLAEPVCRDPDDDDVLALALAAQLDLIVSGDHDLLVLQVFESIPICNAASALTTVRLSQ